jgi:hypothetical protein
MVAASLSLSSLGLESYKRKGNSQTNEVKVNPKNKTMAKEESLKTKIFRCRSPHGEKISLSSCSTAGGFLILNKVHVYNGTSFTRLSHSCPCSL